MPSRTARRQLAAEEEDAPVDGDERALVPTSGRQLTTSQVERRARKSRRIARKLGEAGPSGWKHDEGDERDLVPPSDVEEYEEWKEARAADRSRRETTGSSWTVTPVRSSRPKDVRSGNTVGRIRVIPSHRFLSRTPSTQQLSYSISHDTSPTIPLSPDSAAIDFEDNLEFSPWASDEGTNVDELEGSLEEDEDMDGKSPWPNFFVSPPSPYIGGDGPPETAPPDRPDSGDESDEGGHAPLAEPHTPPSPKRTLSPFPSPQIPFTPPGLMPFESGSTALGYAAMTLTPSLPTPSAASRPSQATQSGSPLIEAQVGSHNIPEWHRPTFPLHAEPSQGTPTRSTVESTHDDEDEDELLLRTPSRIRGGLSLERIIPRSNLDSSPAPPASIGQQVQGLTPHSDAPTLRPLPSNAKQLSTVPPPNAPPPAVADPALEDFRTARTFRTRTVLQLQPYTKERQIYEAALKRGGLKKGKKAIASAREITPNEEDNEVEGQEDESSEAEEEDPERIVIGDTPSLHAQRTRKPMALVDADFDEYFLQFRIPADEEDPTVATRLQRIARSRLRAEKLERKKKKHDERLRREYEQMIRSNEKAQQLNNSSDESLSPAPPLKRPKPVQKTPGRTKTYSKRDQHATTPRSVSRRAVTPISTPPRLASIEPNTYDASRRSILLETVETPSYPVDNLPHSAHMDVDYVSPSFHTAATDIESGAIGAHGEGSFYVDDLPQQSPQRHRHSVSSGSDSESNVSTSIRDPREKIARRMMPVAMLRRLEHEAAMKAKRREERKRREARQTESPARPGRAVVRRAGGAGDVNDFVNLIASSDSEASVSLAPRSPTPPTIRQKDLVIISSNESSASSQAHEDNLGAQSLARLYDGDFETLIAGRRAATKQPTLHRRVSKDGRSHARRPALGLAQRVPVSRPSGTGDRDMVQTRLDFPSQGKPPANHSKRKHKSGKTTTYHVSKSKSLPAIRLDDHVIFATADFDFDDGTPAPIASHTPKRKSAKPAKAIVSADTLDEGVGKARSWANFDKFPVDFGISPLPSGLYCDPASYVGNGSLTALTRLIRGERVDTIDIPAVSAYGVEMQQSMSAAAIQSILPVISDGISKTVVEFANDSILAEPDLSPLTFLGLYICRPRVEADHDMAELRTQCRQAVHTITTSLEGITVSNKTQTREIRKFLISLRLQLLDLTCRSVLVDSEVLGVPDQTPVVGAANGLLRQLLAAGFDKAVKPLKAILRGESESAQVDDPTTIAWIASLHLLEAWGPVNDRPGSFFLERLNEAMETTFPLDQLGPIAAERIWFLTFGLCALSQFEADGRISMVFTPCPRWSLVRRAIGLIRISHNEDAEEKAHTAQLQGRDRYIKTMIARCVRLSAVWKWDFDRESFSVATKDLGVIFKDRQHRNLPTEPPVDYPDFVTHFDMSLTAAEDTRGESAFELYLRLVCVAASDIIGSAESLSAAQQAEKDVQRLIMSIIPVSPVKFNRVLPPTLRQLGQLINRYSTMISACYFSPSLLPWLLANSRKWAPFETADFESRQVVIRGLMYLAVACRHHRTSLNKVVDSLADILSTLQKELDGIGKPSAPAQAPSRLEIERTMVLVVACFRQIIQHHSYDPDAQVKPVYPDPCLLHESWTARIFALDLANDLKCGTEVVATIQAFLDVRSEALPRLARQRREAREKRNESQDEFSFGIDFSTIDLAALGGGGSKVEDPIQKQDDEFAKIINSVISPQIYRLLSDMLPPIDDLTLSSEAVSERQVFIGKLTKCWSDCAGVIVVEQNSPDGWTPYVGPFGRESWQRLRNEHGRMQVGLNFMLNVAKLDPNSFSQYPEVFIALFFQCIVTDKLTIEHKYLAAMLGMPGVFDHPLFVDVAEVEGVREDFDRTRFMDMRGAILQAVFAAIPTILRSTSTASSMKTLIYRCVNLLVSSIISNQKSIHPNRVIHRESYFAFAQSTISDLTRLAGEYITPASVPGLKAFVQ